jgi:hypothetical protein
MDRDDPRAAQQPARRTFVEETTDMTEHRAALEPVADQFRDVGLYAYVTIDDENRWTVACDIEEGHIDVRVGPDSYELEVWATLTGMYVDEESERRRIARERLARISLPGLQRGYLDTDHRIVWDDFEQGIQLRKRVDLPFSAGQRLPAIAVQQLEELNDTLLFIERQLSS